MENKKTKVDFAQKYGLAEKDIQPEFLPMLIAFDDFTEQTKAMTEKFKGSINAHHHHYEGTTPVAAYLLRWGWTTPILIATVLGMLWAFFAWYNPDRNQLKSLKTVVQYDEASKGYFIDARNYELVNPRGKKGFSGIRLILPDSSTISNQAAL